MLSGSSPFTADSEYLTFKKIEALEYAFPAHFPPPAQALIASLLQLDPVRFFAARTDSYIFAGTLLQTIRNCVSGQAVRPTAALPLKAHAFFQECEPPLDFASLTATPPPPLVPPPPPPPVTGDSVINAQLAELSIEAADRKELIGLQQRTRWAEKGVVGADEVIVLATQILKRRHLSVKRRQLLLCDCVQGCRLFYVDPDSMELKGTIPWSDELNAELMPKGCFRIHVPGRTYYMEDMAGSAETAELWVRTLLKMRARRRGGGGGDGGGSGESAGKTPDLSSPRATYYKSIGAYK